MTEGKSFVEKWYDPELAGRQGWVRRTNAAPPTPPDHTCSPPLRGRSPNGLRGDLWRCACGELWRVGLACDWCDRRRRSRSHGGQHPTGLAWLPAKFWQRVWYRRAKR